MQGGLLGQGAEFYFDNVLLAVNAYVIDSAWTIPGRDNMFDNSTGENELLGANFFAGQTGTVNGWILISVLCQKVLIMMLIFCLVMQMQR